jgi:two-component system sensor histidine kinase CpxA
VKVLFRSLFLKIFLWFSAAMATMIVITFAVLELTRPGVFQSHPHAAADLLLSGYAQTAAETYESQGQSGLAAYLDQLEQTTGLHSVLFKSDLKELSGRPLPSGAYQFAQSMSQAADPKTLKHDFPRLITRSVQSPRGEQYLWVAKMPGQPRPWDSDHLLHLFMMVLIGAGFCYWLARYLTAPVTKLRKATNELARGNLSARVGPSLGRRRDELTSLGHDFDVMAEQIESLLKAQRRLLGDISHELRSPLSRLNVALELARQRAGSDAASALTRIGHEAENLNEMIGQLLALTRLETGEHDIVRKSFDLRKLVVEIAEDADFEARGRNKSVRVDANGGCLILGNEELLRRAIENVVRNAVQYTAPGTEVEITLEGGSSNGSQKTNGDIQGESEAFAEITVRDHGNGVPESALSQLFRPFYRVEDARDRESGGTGLGLAITERAVRLHGGEVMAANAPGGGLSITIKLPPP